MKLIIYRFKKLFHFVKTLLLEALPANIYFGFPSGKLKVIAITGTDGKTTTSTLTYNILHHAGKKVGLVSTVAAYIGSEAIDTGFHVTTPQPWELQKFLKRFVDEGYEYVVIETTSHGIYQMRTWGIKPEYAGLTNITQNEALDYHVNYDEYVKAKCSKLRQAKEIWVNKDDESYPHVKKNLSDVNIHSYEALKNIPANVKRSILKRFPEKYNQANATLAYQIAHQIGADDAKIAEAIENFKGVTGRMNFFTTKKGVKVVVDFAHTPNALYQALTSLRTQTTQSSQLFAIFGCAGLRDPRKRAPMGKHAADIADVAIYTAEDPRIENIWSILRQMKEQLTTGHDRMVSIPDRQQAIDFALSKAKKGDIIGIFGKGHETSMAYFGVEYPWNDIEYVTNK